MMRHSLWWLVLLGMSSVVAAGEPEGFALLQRPWFETRSAHFNIYSCSPSPEVNKLAAQLEQFREAYTLLAGTQAVASPPMVVMAFPDSEALKPFLPVYHGQPGSLSGFFKRDSDENLIVLALPDDHQAFTGLEVVFHEYAHLLFRHNARLWPVWLNEGMAEIYSTFEASGFTVRIGKPIEQYRLLLARQPFLPLRELFAVTRDSPQYNERERQGIFYAESWLLTHYLMAGGTVAYQTRFGQFTRLLRAGQLPEQAFTNALQTTLPAMEIELRRYLDRGRFEPIQWALPMDLSAPKMLATRAVTSGEASFRLGNELLRIDRLDDAERYFNQARKLAPQSPQSYEGLGLLAARREQHEAALRETREAVRLGSTSFLVHFIYARERYRLKGDSQNRYAPLSREQAVEIRGLLQKVVGLMPDFGPGHQLLGFFETVQGDNLGVAERHLRRAIELEPENQSYLISLAQVQIRQQDPAAACRTLEPLLLPTADPKLRAHAEEMVKEMGRNTLYKQRKGKS